MTLAPEGRTELDLAAGGCTCCAVDEAHGRADAAASVTTAGLASASYGVEGMTCGNCVRHVTEELTAIDGVDAVEVELVADGVSTVTVRSAAPVAADVVAAAVEEAGYVLVAR